LWGLRSGTPTLTKCSARAAAYARLYYQHVGAYGGPGSSITDRAPATFCTSSRAFTNVTTTNPTSVRRQAMSARGEPGSWTVDTHLSVFRPEAIGPRLFHYADRFPVVQVDYLRERGFRAEHRPGLAGVSGREQRWEQRVVV
jgi:hypothetical protein